MVIGLAGNSAIDGRLFLTTSLPNDNLSSHTSGVFVKDSNLQEESFVGGGRHSPEMCICGVAGTVSCFNGSDAEGGLRSSSLVGKWQYKPPPSPWGTNGGPRFPTVTSLDAGYNAARRSPPCPAQAALRILIPSAPYREPIQPWSWWTLA